MLEMWLIQQSSSQRIGYTKFVKVLKNIFYDIVLFIVFKYILFNLKLLKLFSNFNIFKSYLISLKFLYIIF